MAVATVHMKGVQPKDEGKVYKKDISMADAKVYRMGPLMKTRTKTAIPQEYIKRSLIFFTIYKIQLFYKFNFNFILSSTSLDYLSSF
jgi:hypothetical protein